MGILKSHKTQSPGGQSFVNHKKDKERDNGEANTASQGFVVVTHEELQQLRVSVYPYIL